MSLRQVFATAYGSEVLCFLSVYYQGRCTWLFIGCPCGASMRHRKASRLELRCTAEDEEKNKSRSLVGSLLGMTRPID